MSPEFVLFFFSKWSEGFFFFVQFSNTQILSIAKFLCINCLRLYGLNFIIIILICRYYYIRLDIFPQNKIKNKKDALLFHFLTLSLSSSNYNDIWSSFSLSLSLSGNGHNCVFRFSQFFCLTIIIILKCV